MVAVKTVPPPPSRASGSDIGRIALPAPRFNMSDITHTAFWSGSPASPRC